MNKRNSIKQKIIYKKIKVKSRISCPNMYVDSDAHSRDVCNITNKRIYNSDKINKFCPLENYEKG
jgi:hypothetical protein